MEMRKIYAQDLLKSFDLYHLAKEFYRYIFRYPELEDEAEWKQIKQAAEDLVVDIRCHDDKDNLDPKWYRDFLRFYTSLEMKNYDNEVEFIFEEKHKRIFLRMAQRYKII